MQEIETLDKSQGIVPADHVRRHYVTYGIPITTSDMSRIWQMIFELCTARRQLAAPCMTKDVMGNLDSRSALGKPWTRSVC